MCVCAKEREGVYVRVYKGERGCVCVCEGVCACVCGCVCLRVHARVCFVYSEQP